MLHSPSIAQRISRPLKKSPAGIANPDYRDKLSEAIWLKKSKSSEIATSRKTLLAMTIADFYSTLFQFSGKLIRDIGEIYLELLASLYYILRTGAPAFTGDAPFVPYQLL